MPDPISQTEYWNSSVGDEWASQADRIDAMFQPLTQTAISALKLQPGERVLDVGCGGGATAMAIARAVGADGRVVGVDVSQPLLDLARRRTARAQLDINFVEADASASEITGAPFDAAFSRFGIMFFEDSIAAFSNIRRALRADGRMVFVCWRAIAENAWSSAALRALAPMLKSPLPPPNPSLPGPFRFADPEKVDAILNAAGWRDIAIAPWDGAVAIGGGGSVRDAAAFLLKIGPSARAITDQGLDRAEAEALITQHLIQHEGPSGVALPAACWIVSARA